MPKTGKTRLKSKKNCMQLEIIKTIYKFIKNSIQICGNITQKTQTFGEMHI